MISSTIRLAASRFAARSAIRASSAPLTASRAVISTNVNSFVSPLSQQHLVLSRHFGASTFLDPNEVSDRIVEVVKNFDKVDASKVTSSSKFADDLGLDSLDAVEVVMAIEDEFAIEIPDAEADKITSIADAVEYIAGHPMAK